MNFTSGIFSSTRVYIINIFNKISIVKKKKVERTKYSELIVCPLIKYIYFRIRRKGKLEREEETEYTPYSKMAAILVFFCLLAN